MAYLIKRPAQMHGEMIKRYRKELIDSELSADGCGRLLEFEDPDLWLKDCWLYEQAAGLLEGWANTYQYIYCDDEEIVGMINIRTDIEQSPFLKMYGGHIGYSVLPSKRGMGIGKQMLKDFLGIVKKDYSIDQVMITCLKSNVASRKTIEACGGKFIDEIWFNPEKDYVERYRIEI